MNPATKREPLTLKSTDCEQAIEAWDQICEALSSNGHLFLFTDFDGTLARITQVPRDATIEPRAFTALKRLMTERRITIAVLSGRSVSDVADRVGLPVIYGGDHGFEIHGPEFQFVVPEAEVARRRLPAICNDIRQKTTHIPGTLVEAKRYTASIHYRQVRAELVPEVLSIVRSAVDSAEFEIREGHCVFEVRPRLAWGKGEAVKWILDRYAAADAQAVCLGDDETDEDMFRCLPRAVNIRVDRPSEISTSAQYCIRQDSVAELIEGLREIVQGLSCASSVDARVPWHSS